MSNVIIFPTDTVYGLGAHYLDKDGIKRIYTIKGRDFNNPIAILVSSIEEAHLIGNIHPNALKVINHFWPGGLTIVVNSSKSYLKSSGEKTIGLRMPNHPTALELIKMYGPLKTTSVNLSHEVPLNDYDMIMKVFGDQVNKVYPNEFLISQVSSTVVDFTHDFPHIIRQGDISIEQIMKVLEK